MRNIIRKISCITLIFSVTLLSVCGDIRVPGRSNTASVSKAAANTGKYLKDIRISYASSRDAAGEELGEEYTILDRDFNKGKSSPVWIGYSTTDNPDIAITDIKVMDMNGEFNYSDYQELLKNQEQAIQEQLDAVIPSIKEYAKNYDAGTPAAKGTTDYLNCFIENDSEKKMGDYLLDAGRALNKNGSDNAVINDLKKVFLQGNTQILQSIEAILMQTQGTMLKKEGSWLTRMSGIGPDGLMEEYKKAYPTLNKNRLKNNMKNDLDDCAKKILDELSTLRDILKDTNTDAIKKALDADDPDAFEKAMELTDEEESGKEINSSMTEDEITDSLTETMGSAAEEVKNSQSFIDGEIVMHLMITPYGDNQSMYDFFMRKDLEPEDLYPMAYVMSNGQKSLMDDVGLYPLFSSIMAGDADEIEKTENILPKESISIYEGSDRGAFDGDTAITGEAMKRASSSGKSLFMDSTAYNVIMALSFLISAGAFVYAATWKPKMTALEANDYYAKTLDEAGRKANIRAVEASYNYDKLTIDTRRAKFEYFRKNDLILNKAMAAKLEDNAQWAYEMLLQKQKPEIYNKLYAKDGLFTKLDQKLAEAKKLYIDTNRGSLDASSVRQNMAKKLSKGSRFPKGGARAIGIVFGAVAVAMAAYEIYCMVHKEKTEYSEIPSQIIDRSYPEGSEEIVFMNYDVALTADDKKADIHNHKGDKWVALYTTTDKAAGNPIVAGTLFADEDALSTNPDLIAVKDFGGSASYNLSIAGDEAYIYYSDNENAITADEDADENEVKTENAASGSAVSGTDVDTTGSAFGGSAWIWILLLALIALIAACASIVYAKKHKK